VKFLYFCTKILVILRPLILVFWVVSTSLSWAASSTSWKGYVVHDFQDDWRVYDYEREVYVPYIAEKHSQSPVHTWVGDLREYRGYTLQIRVLDQPAYLFVNGSLQQRLEPNETLRWQIDSLIALYPVQPWVLTLYGSTSLAQKQVRVMHEIEQVPLLGLETSSETAVRPRNRMTGRTAISVLSVIGILLFSFLGSAFPKAFFRFFNPLDWVTFLMRESSFLVNKPLNRVNLLFILLLCQISVVLYYLLESKGLRLFSTTPFLASPEGVYPSLFTYIRLMVLFYIGYMVKYFYIGLVGRLFNLDKIIDIHYFKAIQGAILFYSVVFVGLMPLFLGYFDLPSSWVIWFKWAIICFYLVRGLMLYFTIIRTLPVQILYLISYLCLVELLPLMVGIRFAF